MNDTPKIVKRNNTKKIMIIVTIIVLITLSFWIFSRYPALNEKAMMAKGGKINDLISIWPVFTVSESDHWFVKVAKSFINWVSDNKKGMTFGVLVSTLILSLFKYIEFRESRNYWVNALYGILIGSPLGVCVNCAMPVWKSFAKNKKLETSFALIFSSPTLNVVILTMTFSLFPFYLALLKVLHTLILIFVLIPLISKIIGSKDTDSIPALDKKIDEILNNSECEIPSSKIQNWPSSLKEVGVDLLKSFKFVFVSTVPWMFVAGIIGSSIAHSVDLSGLNSNVQIISLAAVSFFSLLVPLPVTFDVMITHALYAQGLDISYAAILLCNLSIFSVYAGIIICTSGYWRWAAAIFTTLFVSGIGVGLLSPILHNNFYLAPNISAYQQLKASESANVSQDPMEHQASDHQSSSSMEQQFKKHILKADPEKGITISSKKFQMKSKTKINSRDFSKIEGFEIGLKKGFSYKISDYPDPHWIGRGTASGDFNKDGWTDLAFGSSKGLILYKNSGKYFNEVDLHIEAAKNLNVYSVAFVDLNNDSWLDMVITTFQTGNFAILNDTKGGFVPKLEKIPNGEGIITLSPSFADLTGNGYLDIYNGNIALGVVTGSWTFKGKGRSNSITFNDNMVFYDIFQVGISGETMSTLISDLNDDGYSDLYQANDFIVPDSIRFGPIQDPINSKLYTDHSSTNSGIDRSPFYSMGVDSGDLNNDGRLDLVVTGTVELSRLAAGKISKFASIKMPESTGGTFENTPNLSDIRQNNPCNQIKLKKSREACEEIKKAWRRLGRSDFDNPNIEECKKISDPIKREECLLGMMWKLLTSNSKNISCDSFQEDDVLKSTCKILTSKSKAFAKKELDSFSKIKQLDTAFAYIQTEDGKFKDINESNQENFVHPGGWTWNTKIFDIDNDGFQDIFNSEGAIRETRSGWNTYMKNRGNGSFEEFQWAAGSTDPFSLFSFTSIDFDFDGDLDIIGNSSAGPVQVYKNESQNNSISIKLEDSIGNYFGIGTKIFIFYGNVDQQVREIKASGGYQSFDAPAAYFGLGKITEISNIRVKWPDGTIHDLEGPWPSGFQYTISRHQDKLGE